MNYFVWGFIAITLAVVMAGVVGWMNYRQFARVHEMSIRIAPKEKEDCDCWACSKSGDG